MKFIKKNENTSEFLENFFKNYWENKYIFLKDSFSPKELSFTADDLIEMAQDEYFETRLVKQDNEDHWEVSDGPHPDFDFTSKKALWTLIVHNLNLYDQFSFDLEKNISRNYLRKTYFKHFFF